MRLIVCKGELRLGYSWQLDLGNTQYMLFPLPHDNSERLIHQQNPEITAVGDGDRMHKFYYFSTAIGEVVMLQRMTMALIILAYLTEETRPSYEAI